MNLNRISKKVPHEDKRMTLLAIHKNKLQEFENKTKELPEMLAQLEQLKLKYKCYRPSSTNTSCDLFSLKKQIEKLESEIEKIRNKTDYSEYQLKAMNFIDEYKGADANCNKGQLSRMFIQECFGSSLEDPQNSSVDDRESLTCSECGADRIIDKKSALAICNVCGIVENYQDCELFAEFSDEIEVLSPFSYRRSNHFKEWISMLLARESSSPPDYVIDALLAELKKNKIYDKKQITPERIREYLRRLGLNKQYEHIPLIIHKICGTTPPKISRELENELMRLFEEIQAPFEKHKPPGRKNFLSYSYCIYKFCQLLGQDHLLPSLTLLKSREKLHSMDKVWEKICIENGYQYYASI
jgi:hypothetical protein